MIRLPHFSERRRRQHRRGFSLVELMVAMTVFLILAAAVAQLISSTNQAIRLSKRQSDTAAQARLVFNRMDRDITQMLLRQDVDLRIAPGTATGGENVLKFLSAVTSPNRIETSGNRGLSLIGYKVDENELSAGRLVLMRGSSAIHWSDVGFMGLDNNAEPVVFESIGTTGPNLSDDTYDIIAEGVFRITVMFQLNPSKADPTTGEIAIGPLDTPGSTLEPADGTLYVEPPVREINGKNFIDLTKISAIVVGIAVCDTESRKTLNPEQLRTMAERLPDLKNGQLPTRVWGPIAEDPDNFPGVPKPVAQSIRIFQRAFPIHLAWSTDL